MVPDSKSAQMAVRPRKARPITRCPTLTGCRPEVSRTASGSSAAVCVRSWSRRSSSRPWLVFWWMSLRSRDRRSSRRCSSFVLTARARDLADAQVTSMVMSGDLVAAVAKPSCWTSKPPLSCSKTSTLPDAGRGVDGDVHAPGTITSIRPMPAST